MTALEEQLKAVLRARIEADKEVTPKSIGEESGVDYSTIYKYLADKCELRSHNFAKLCSWAGLILVHRDGQIASAPPPSEQRIQELAEDLALKLISRMVDWTLDDLRRGSRP